MPEAIARKYAALSEAADWYGVSERTIRRRISEGRLAAVRVGPRVIRVRLDDLETLGDPIPVVGQVAS
jgi:excisionase family DNA binding protein